uniref:preprotein translocase subunit SecE n=1 Tax=Petrachloros mirabilis TaxID=2918835 RepID=UPI003083FC81
MTKKEVSEKSVTGGLNPSDFLKETKEELDKVVWPDRQQLISESAAVVLMVSVSAALISLIDRLFRWISQLIF